MATRTWSVTTRSAALRRTAAFRGRTARRAGAVAAPAHELAPAVGSHVHPHDRGDDPLPVSEPAQADPEPTPALARPGSGQRRDARAGRRCHSLAHERDPRALVLVALARLGKGDRVGSVRGQRGRLAGECGLPLGPDDVRVAAGGGGLVVVPLEGAVAREGAVPGIRGNVVDLERGAPALPAVAR